MLCGRGSLASHFSAAEPARPEGHVGCWATPHLFRRRRRCIRARLGRPDIHGPAGRARDSAGPRHGQELRPTVPTLPQLVGGPLAALGAHLGAVTSARRHGKWPLVAAGHAASQDHGRVGITRGDQRSEQAVDEYGAEDEDKTDDAEQHAPPALAPRADAEGDVAAAMEQVLELARISGRHDAAEV